jgi:hypothetical protein
MKRVAFLAFALTLLASLSLGQPAGSLEFDGYPAVAAKKTANAIDFRNSPGAWNFRTRLREAIKGEVNFAGRYILTGWGCGTGCSQMAIIDAKTGRVFMPDALAGVSAWYYDVDDDYEVYTYKKDSRLLVVRGIPGPMTDGDSDQEPGTYYYEWRANRLRLIKSVSKEKPNA